MTTAKVEYFSGRYGLGYYHLNFYGDDSKYYKDRWHDIEFNKYDKNKKQIEKCEVAIEDSERIINECKSKIKATKKWYRFWYTTEERDLRKQIKQEQGRIEELAYEIATLDDDLFYEHYELHVKGEMFLEANGFILTNASEARAYHSSPTETEVWTKN